MNLFQQKIVYYRVADKLIIEIMQMSDPDKNYYKTASFEP